MVPIVLAANLARAAALFVLEIAPVPPSEFLHSLIGAGAFTAMGLTLVGVERFTAGCNRRPVMRAKSRIVFAVR